MEDLIKLKWFRYSQNNSGGVFHKPAKSVYIQAQDENNANDIAEENGLYFNGCRNGRDCDCCGDRWGFPWDEKEGELVIEKNDFEDWFSRDGVPKIMIVPLDKEPIFPTAENGNEVVKTLNITN